MIDMGTKVMSISHSELKKKMLDASIKKHQTVIDDFRMRIQDMLGSEAILNVDDMDLSQRAFNSELVEKSNNIADQISFANEEMKLLYDMAPTINNIHNTVQLGSVLVTDKAIFFVSASIEQFDVDGQTVLGLSTKSPLFQVMKGKKKGESFTYKDNTYHIKELF